MFQHLHSEELDVSLFKDPTSLQPSTDKTREGRCERSLQDNDDDDNEGFADKQEMPESCWFVLTTQQLGRLEDQVFSCH